MEAQSLAAHVLFSLIVAISAYYILRVRSEDFVRSSADPARTRNMSLPYDQFILFGDSLFQHSSSQDRGYTLAPALQAGAFQLQRP